MEGLRRLATLGDDLLHERPPAIQRIVLVLLRPTRTDQPSAVVEELPKPEITRLHIRQVSLDDLPLV